MMWITHSESRWSVDDDSEPREAGIVGYENKNFTLVVEEIEKLSSVWSLNGVRIFRKNRPNLI